MSRVLVIGTRGSDLARWQAHYVQRKLGVDTEIRVIKTEGDAIQHLPLDKVEGKGFFTKEIEKSLLGGEIDIAVHSYKDLPTEDVPGLHIAAVPERAPVADVLVVRRERLSTETPFALPFGARVGTSSLRRQAMLRSLRNDLELINIRGNVPTRLGRARSGELDAVILAEAGLRRLGFYDQEPELAFESIGVKEVTPAPAQGALAIQCRRDDTRATQAVASLHHPATAHAVTLERSLLSRFGGGCHLPLGAYATRARWRADYRLFALVAAPDGAQRLVAQAQGRDPTRLVEDVYAKLVQQGARRHL